MHVDLAGSWDVPTDVVVDGSEGVGRGMGGAANHHVPQAGCTGKSLCMCVCVCVCVHNMSEITSEAICIADLPHASLKAA